MIWQVNSHCPHCGVRESLISKGLYNHVWLMMDLKKYYYVPTEYMECWNFHALLGIVDQLTIGVCACYSVLMTCKYACDQSVIALLRRYTLRNSPTALCNTLYEIDSEEWLRNQLHGLPHQVYIKETRRAISHYAYLAPNTRSHSPFLPSLHPHGFWRHMCVMCQAGWMIC